MDVAPSGINLLRFMISKMLRIEDNTNRTITKTKRILYSFLVANILLGLFNQFSLSFIFRTVESNF